MALRYHNDTMTTNRTASDTTAAAAPSIGMVALPEYECWIEQADGTTRILREQMAGGIKAAFRVFAADCGPGEFVRGVTPVSDSGGLA